MSQQIIGKVSIIPCGEFKPNTKYSRLSVVEYLGSYYIAVIDNENIPISNTNVWYLLSSKGEKGEQGIQGEQGEPGDAYNIDPEELQAVIDEIASNASDIFNSNATNKTNAFNENATNKTSAFNANAANKTSAFNENATNKTNAFNDNVNVRTSTFDSHVESEIQYFDTEFNNKLSNLEIIATNPDQKLSSKSDYIEITDGLNSTIKDFTLYGNSYQVVTTGKQLFDKDTATYSADNRGLDSNGNDVYASGYKYTTSYVVVDAESQYTIQGSFNSSSHITRIYYYTSNEEWISRSDTFGTSPYTFTTPPNCGKIRFMVYNSLYNASTIMIQKGATASSYEIYTGAQPSPAPDYPQKVHMVTGDVHMNVTGKNILPNNASSTTINGITFTVNADGSITANGTASAKTTFYMNNNGTITNGGTYTISSGLNGTSGVRFGIQINGVYYNTNTSRTETFEKITSQTASYYQIDNGITVNNLTLYPMIEIGNIFTSYDAYKGQSQLLSLGSMELCEVGDYQDALFKAVEGNKLYDSLTTEQKSGLVYGKNYKYKVIDKTMFDGSEAWGLQNNVFVTYTLSKLSYDNTLGKILVLCDQYYGRGTTYRDSVGNLQIRKTYVTGSSNVQIGIKNIAYETVNDFKASLASSPITIYYVLQVPEFIEITDETLSSQIDGLYQTQIYKNMTNIIFSSYEISPDGQVIYVVNPLSSIMARLDLLEG